MSTEELASCMSLPSACISVSCNSILLLTEKHQVILFCACARVYIYSDFKSHFYFKSFKGLENHLFFLPALTSSMMYSPASETVNQETYSAIDFSFGVNHCSCKVVCLQRTDRSLVYTTHHHLTSYTHTIFFD